MLNKNMKLLMENFKSFLKEAEVPPAQTPAGGEGSIDPAVAQKVDQIIKLPYQEFVTQLSAIAGDPKVQAVLKHGLQDGKPADEVVEITNIEPSVTALKPTQNEVDIDKSLAYPLKDPRSLQKYLTATEAVKAGPNPIVTAANGTLVIDGHHRWSQVYAINKNAKMKAININIKGASPETYLKVVQMAIAADIGKLPVANTGPGINLLNNAVTKDQIRDYISKKISKNVVLAVGYDNGPLKKLFPNFAGSQQQAAATPQPASSQVAEGALKSFGAAKTKAVLSLSEMIFSNILSMRETSQPVAPASPRKFMPQTDDATKWSEKANSGMVNFIEPATVNEQKLAARISQLLKEELKKIKR